MIPDIEEFNSSVKLRCEYIKNHYPELYDIIKYYPVDSISEKLYWFYNDIHSHPVCEVCGSEDVAFMSLHRGYKTICSQKCGGKSEKVKEKVKQTKLQKYGDAGYNNHSKAMQTTIERYGGIGNGVNEFSDKRKKTLKEKYNNENYVALDKIKQTNLERYGVEFAIANKEVREKSKKTNLERYGAEYVLDHNSSIRKDIDEIVANKYGDGDIKIAKQRIQNKTRNTLKDKYGVENPNQVPTAKQHRKQTCLSRYGVEHPMKCEDIIKSCVNAKMNTFIETHPHIISASNGTWTVKCPHPNCTKCTERNYTISSMNYWGRFQTGVEPCTKILPIQPSTNRGTTIELFVRNILDMYNIEYLTNVRNIIPPEEIDIYIPSLKIGIECNGIFWHTTANTDDNNKHYKKAKKCQNAGIQLLTLWEDWIVTKPHIVESIIINKIGKCSTTIYARNCNIKEIESKVFNEFLQQNHIQGQSKTQNRYGLYYNNDLVSVMGFRKHKDRNEYELMRFCSKLNTRVVGGASKLLHFFIKQFAPKTIISFAMNDISNGNLYKKLGFNYVNESTTYWYIDSVTMSRYHKSSFSKDNLIKRGIINIKEKNSITEKKAMENTRYYRIYDSGIAKYILTL